MRERCGPNTWDACRCAHGIDLTAEGAKPSAVDIKKFLMRVRRTVLTLEKYEDSASVNQLQEYITELEGMQAAVRKEDPGEALKSKSMPRAVVHIVLMDYMIELPKSLRDALENLASTDDVQAIDQLIRASLENVAEDQEPFELDLDDTIDITDWKEGVEELSKVPEEELWRRLGMPNQKIDLFQEWTDPNCTIAPWSDSGQAWLCDPLKGRVPLRPRWHQLVGILRILERTFNGEPVLLMDGVGIGKTLQVVGAIACLAYYHRYYSKNNHFPGIFSE